MKTIVTHLSPDLDAIASAWLVVRNFPDGWDKAEFAFVPAGTTLNKRSPDSNREIIHVDTGFGKFDHHQSNAKTCATKLVFEEIVSQKYLPEKHIPALSRMVDVITTIDHFGEFFFPEPSSDKYQFMLYEVIEGMKSGKMEDSQLVEQVFPMLDGVFQLFKNKVRAEEEIKQGFILNTRWGKTIVLETKNEETMKLSMMMGYHMVVRRDPDRGFVRVKTQPKDELDLTKLAEKLKWADPKATWFLHASKHMLLNGSSKNPDSVPSVLPMKKLIEIIREI